MTIIKPELGLLRYFEPCESLMGIPGRSERPRPELKDEDLA
jgi:hypothetical protein